MQVESVLLRCCVLSEVKIDQMFHKDGQFRLWQPDLEEAMALAVYIGILPIALIMEG